MHESARRVKQVGEIAYGITPARIPQAGQTGEDAYRELKRLGVKCFLHNGLEYNYNGKSYVDNGETATLADGSVGVYIKAFGDGIEYAGHEAFHSWAKDNIRDEYVGILRANINFINSTISFSTDNSTE